MEQTQNIADMTIADLLSQAKHTPCRYLSAAYSQMAHAKQALALGDRQMARLHCDRSKAAYALALESEALRVQIATAKVVAQKSDGLSTCVTDGVFYGGQYTVHQAEIRTSHGQLRSEMGR